MAAIGRAWGVILLAVVVLGGIYSGIFTVNEAAAIGVVITFLFALLRRRLDRATFLRVMAEASGSTAMIYIMVITLPFVILVIQGLGYDLVWWRIINVVVIGIGLITPPIGINVMLLKVMYRDVRITTIYRGIVPFLVADLLRLTILVLFPALTLWLPSVIG